MGFPERYALNTPAIDVRRLPRAPNPVIIWVTRMLLVLGVCALSLCVLVISILTIKWYNDHEPIVKPSWGSLIFLVVLSLITPITFFGYHVALPLAPFLHPGDILYSLLDVKVEILFQFSMCVLWVSGTLAYFEDLAGRGACEFDSYYHYAIPDDWEHVCDLRDLIWPFCFSVFALLVFLFLIELACAGYIFFFLDQEVLNEPHYSWGRRAYDFQKGRHTTQKSERAARAARAEEKFDPEHGPFDPTMNRSMYADGFAPEDESSAPTSSQSLSSRSRSRVSVRRGQAYTAATPMEDDAPSPDESLHEAGPYVGPVDHQEAFASNRERGYGAGTLAVSHEGGYASSAQGSTTRLAARRGVTYGTETPAAEDDLPNMGMRGKHAYEV